MYRGVRHLLVLGDGSAKEYLAVLLAVGQRTETVGQAPLGDHVARDRGGPFDIVGRPGGYRVLAEYQLLGHAAAEQAGDLADQALLRVAVAVDFRQEHSHAQGAAARDDGDLVHRIVFGHVQAHDGMPGFVVGGELALLGAHHHGFALGAHQDLVLGLLELLHCH